MTVNQIYEVVNSVAQQAYGESAIQATDLTGLIAMGDTVLSTETNKDIFVKALADRIGMTIISNKPYTAKTKGMLMNKISFGVAIQKIYTEPEDAVTNSTWTINEGDQLGPGTVHIPTTHQSIFVNRNAWEYDITLPDEQLSSAFTGPEEMASFIASITMQIENSMAISLENMSNLCIANFIGEKINFQSENAGTGIQAINLLHEYNTETNETLTVASALRSLDFLKWASKRINLVLDKFPYMSQLFNTKEYKRFTNKEDMNVLMLSDFARSTDSYLEADTYHNELVSLPGYEVVPYWQGMGLAGNFSDVSKIDITTSDGDVVTKSGIVGFVYDKNALGVMFDKKNTTTYYDTKKEVTQVYNKAAMGYFNDLSENAVVFYLEEV